jgi:hypothetical protein
MKNPALITVAAIGLLGLSAGAQASPSLCDAAAGNLVQNCGFEAGLNSWSQAGLWPSAYPTWNEVRSDYANSGLHSMGDGNYSPSYPNNPQGLGGVSQIISDVAGAAYNFSFWIMPSVDNSAGSDPGGVPKQKYVVYWNGTLLLDQSSQPWTPWTNFSYTVPAPSNSSSRTTSSISWR